MTDDLTDEEWTEKIKNLKAPPFDARFPNTNQTNNCRQNYMDFHRCVKSLTSQGRSTVRCGWYRKMYKGICPEHWVEQWDEQIENGTFPGKI